MGEFQGKRWDEFDTRAFWDYAANHHYQQAENIRDFYDRVYNFLDELKGKPEGRCWFPTEACLRR